MPVLPNSGSSSHLLQGRSSHVQFAASQPAMRHSQSLRKVEQSSAPTFSPDIHELPFEIYPERTKTEASRMQIRERLADDGRAKAESLRVLKASNQTKQVNEYCTFQPQVSEHSKRLVPPSTLSHQSTHQRLYQQGVSRLKTLQDQSNLLPMTSQDKQNCTFQPNLARPKTDNSELLVPIYQRLEKIIAQKKEYMKKLQENKYQSEVQNKPELSQQSKAICEKKPDFKKNVLDRLFSYMRDKNDRLEKMTQLKEDQTEKQCTFRPTLSEYYSYQPEKQTGDFLQRQEKEAEKAKEKILNLHLLCQAPFQPTINKLSSLLVEAQRFEQTEEERIERLHGQPQLQRKAQLERLQEDCYKHCTFKPEINPLSRNVKGTPHQHKCGCKPKEEHYQFHPQICPKSRQLAQRVQPKNKQDNIPAVELARLEQEYKQMKQCTFRPKTLGDRYRSASSKGAVLKELVKGADSYHMRVQKVKARKKEEQDLKQKLFHMDKQYVERRETKAQPFRLSQGPNKINQLKEQAEEEFKKHHPFRPDRVSIIR